MHESIDKRSTPCAALTSSDQGSGTVPALIVSLKHSFPGLGDVLHRITPTHLTLSPMPQNEGKDPGGYRQVISTGTVAVMTGT